MDERLDNINIEKNKELFEYEMTEVLLNLKGEFSAFSGEDTRYSELAVEDEKLHVAIGNIPEIDYTDPQVEVPSATVDFSIPEKLEDVKVEVSVPDIKLDPAGICLSDGAVPVEIGINVPQTNMSKEKLQITDETVPVEIGVDVPQVRMDKEKLQIGDETVPVEIGINVPQTNMSKEKLQTTDEAAPVEIGVRVPQISMSREKLQTTDEVVPVEIGINVPQISMSKEKLQTTDEAVPVKIGVSVPQVRMSQEKLQITEGATTVEIGVAVPQINRDTDYRITIPSETSGMNISVNLPVTTVSPELVSLPESNESVKLKINTPAADFESTNLNIKDEISVEEISLDIPSCSIDDITAASHQVLNAFTIEQRMNAIQIPDKPDVEAAKEYILSLL